MARHQLALVLCALAGLGCPEEGAPAEEPSGSEQAAAEPAPAEAAPGTDVGSSPPAGKRGEPAEVTVKESLFENNLPSDDPLEVELHVEGPSEMAVWLEGFDAECGPVPDLNARVLDDELRLFQRFEQDAPDCIGRHSMKLRVDVPRSSAIERVVVFGPDGKRLGAATVSAEE